MKRVISLLLILGLLPPLLMLSSCNRGEPTVAVVKVCGDVVARLPLDTDTELLISGKGGTNHLVIRDGKVWIDSADCKNQICVKTGKLDGTGPIDMISCLPHEMVVILERE